MATSALAVSRRAGPASTAWIGNAAATAGAAIAGWTAGSATSSAARIAADSLEATTRRQIETAGCNRTGCR